jgi:hypothetical protein
MALLVAVSAVSVEFVVTIEALPAEAALRVALEASLIYRTRMVVPKSIVLLELRGSEQLMFVRESLLVPGT